MVKACLNVVDSFYEMRVNLLYCLLKKQILNIRLKKTQIVGAAFIHFSVMICWTNDECKLSYVCMYDCSTQVE